MDKCRGDILVCSQEVQRKDNDDEQLQDAFTRRPLMNCYFCWI